VALAAFLVVSAACGTSVNQPFAPADAATHPDEVTPSGERNDASAVSSIRAQHGSIVHISPLFGTPTGPLIDLRGTGGFRFDGFASADVNATGTFFPACISVVGCPADTVLQFSTNWAGSTLAGGARLRGQVYENIGSLDPDAGVSILLSGTVAFPAHTADTAVVSAPFELGGQFVDFIGSGRSYDLTGGGVVTFSLQWSDVDQSWYVVKADFNFRPGQGSR
jgi:hypothetical protein